MLLKFQALLKVKPQLLVLMTSPSVLRHTTTKVSDSLNGELLLRSVMALQLSSLSKKTLGDWPDTLQSAKRTVWFQSLSLRFLLMATTLLTLLLKFSKKSMLLSLRLFMTTIFSSRVCSSSQTWSLLEPTLLLKFLLKKSLKEPLLVSLEPSHLLSQASW